MAANLNGNSQTYEPFALRIFQGLQPDIVCLQEFNYGNNTPADFRAMVDTAFGTNFVYYREPYTNHGDIPNGVISRHPIRNSGYWPDPQVGNRGFAWAQIDVPGSNDLYVVSIHLLTTSSAARGAEAANLKTLIHANFPTNAWIIVAGDLNPDSRTETPAMTTFKSYLSDDPIPADNEGNFDTSMNRNAPRDYVLPSFSFTNLQVATVLPSHSFPNGLVFDSRVYTPLSDVPPVLLADSGNAQHMAVIKDFSVPIAGAATNHAPSISTQPQSQTVFVGQNATFAVSASGAAPLAYQWRFSGTNIVGATTNSYTHTNAQTNDAGSYAVVITNSAGSVTSAVATLTVNQPQTGTPTTLVGWDVSVLSGYGPSPLSPTTNAANLTIVGLTRGPGVGTSSTAAGRAWGGNDFTSTSAATAINAGDFATFSIAANAGYKVSFTAISQFDYRRSSTGPTSGVLQYQIGVGAFTDLATLSYSSSASSGASLSALDLSGIAALQNLAAGQVVTFRIVNYGASSSGGTWYVFDTASSAAPDFAVQGIVASAATTNPPAARPVLTSAGFSGSQFSFVLTGSTGSNYIVQVSTNLSASNWISLQTNASPFTFTDFTATNFSQRFYRAVAP